MLRLHDELLTGIERLENMQWKMETVYTSNGMAMDKVYWMIIG